MSTRDAAAETSKSAPAPRPEPLPADGDVWEGTYRGYVVHVGRAGRYHEYVGRVEKQHMKVFDTGRLAGVGAKRRAWELALAKIEELTS